MARSMNWRMCCFWLIAVAQATVAQSSIELRQSARITPGTAISLSQVARLTGPDAVALGDVQIRDAEHAATGEVTVEDVERALNAAGKLNWGRIAVRGSKCVLTVPVSMRSTSRTSGPSPKSDLPKSDVPAQEVHAAGTVREAIVARIAQMLHAAREDLRVTFSAQDDEFLALSTAGRVVEVRATADADRMPLAVTMFDGDRIVGGPKTLRVGVQIRHQVVTAAKVIKRGDVFGPDDFRSEERWLGPTAKPAAMDQVAGAEARSRLDAGETVMADDVAPATTVSKGDIVMIRCVSGSVALTTRGRAMADGCDGDIVEFQALDSKRVFRARMNGRGCAVISTDGPDEKPGRREAADRSPSVQLGLESMR